MDGDGCVDWCCWVVWEREEKQSKSVGEKAGLSSSAAVARIKESEWSNSQERTSHKQQLSRVVIAELAASGPEYK